MSQKAGSRGGAAAKGKKPTKGAGAADEKRDDAPLQAVVLADSFQPRFKPFTVEKPRCLLPLANTPLIEYTLDFLASNGVQDVFIYCGPGVDQVENYINESPRWSPTGRNSPFASLQFIRIADARSMGDFLRDLDKRGLIGGDFLLVHGDLVANIQLDDALARHRARREANQDAIMTVVLREAGAFEHRTKVHGITPTFVIEPGTGRCLHYEETNPLQSDRYVTLDPLILENREFEIRTDLIDCEIDICTPHVLALWSESFDYELPRKNFLHGVLKDWELNGKLIYTDVVQRGYSARASNLQLYDAISRDIQFRWTSPLCPDNNMVAGHSYQYADKVFQEKNVTLAADSEVAYSVLGGRTSVGAGSTVRDSVIGRRCHIGKNVTITGSYIWDDVTIEDNATVRYAVIASGATVGRDSYVSRGSLVSFGVQIGDNIALPDAEVLSLLSHDGKPVAPDTQLLGPNARGAEYKDMDGDGDGDGNGGDDNNLSDPAALQKSLFYSLAHLSLSSSSISTLSSSFSDEEDDVDSQITRPTSDAASRSRLPSFASDDSGGALGGGFHADAVSGLLDALRADGGDFDSAKLEFMGLRLSNDASDSSVRRAVAAAFARRAAELLEPEHGGLEPAKAAEKAVARKKGAAKFLREVGAGGGEQVAEQAELALALQKALLAVRALDPARAGTLLAALLQQLYALDVLEEDGILAWWGDARAGGAEKGEGSGSTMAVAKERCRVLVEWLENAEEDDSGDEEDSDDEDDDEDED